MKRLILKRPAEDSSRCPRVPQGAEHTGPSHARSLVMRSVMLDPGFTASPVGSNSCIRITHALPWVIEEISDGL